MGEKLRIAVLFGGKSPEHEVSLQSARNVMDAIDKEKYDVIPVGIDKEGHWLTGEQSTFLLNADDPKRIRLNPAGENVALVTSSGAPELASLSQESQGRPVDAVFPVLHGPLGEDGAVQGLLKLAGVPFVGPDVLGAAVGMDKDVMKRLLREAGLPTPRFLVFRRGRAIGLDGAVAELGLPLFVKPANLGSSVGIHKAHDVEELETAAADAFQYDNKIVLEEAINGREIECAVLGNDEPIASVPGEIIPRHEFYSYEAKYIDENGAELCIPAELAPETAENVRNLAVQAFQVLCCEGLARVDFFLREDGGLLVNEINTIPGFTRISMYPKLWEATGIGYKDLIERLLQLAIDRHRGQSALKTSFDM